MRAANYLGPGGLLTTAIDAYEHRPSQLRMAECVEDVMRSGGTLLVEAGTGTGKTLAYLVPALLSERRVVVSTGTKALQDQIMNYDLPLLEAHLGRPIAAASMKGLSNYLCLRRYDEFRHGAGSTRHPRELPILVDWAQRTKHGDRSELAELAESAAIWNDVVSGTDTRIGPRCAHYEDCFVTKMRRRAAEAQLVVVNHHLFFADLAMRGSFAAAAVMPEYDVVIFDEAHQIEDVVTQFFGVSCSTSQLERLARDLERACERARIGTESRGVVSTMLSEGANFFARLPRTAIKAGGTSSGRLPLSPGFFQRGDFDPFRFDTALEAAAMFAQRHGRTGENFRQLSRRLTKVRDDLALIAEGNREGRVVWTETRGRSTSIGSSPVDVSSILREEVLYRVEGTIFTSATLSTGGSFSFIKRRLGIETEVSEEILPSPFDYERQAALYIARTLPDPRDAEYLDAAGAEIETLVQLTGGGAFVLCTSVRVMDELCERGRNRLQLPVFRQGEAPTANLLARFRESGNAVLYATASFWEGIDVPGDALRLVIIDKLPFDVPNDPLVAARCARIEEDGESPFMKYLVPAAALSLKQGFGRLIRSRRDRGVVAILDRRIVAKGYGSYFLKSLPPARRCETIDEVRTFWRGVEA